MTENGTLTEPAPGVYAIVAYSLVLMIPREYPLTAELPLGPFTLNGSAVPIALGAWWTIWAVMLIGLMGRAGWAYRLGLAVFALHIMLNLANGVRWWLETKPPASAGWQIAVSPGLLLVSADMLVIAYLFERRTIFARRRPAKAVA